MGSFRFNVPPSASALNQIEAEAAASRVMRGGRGIVVKTGLFGSTIELADQPPRIFARVTRVDVGSGSGASGSGGSGSGDSGSGSGEACPAGSKPVYAFVEVQPTCGGQWEDKPNGWEGDGGESNPAYTMNDATIADGLVAELVPGALWWNGERFVQEWVIVSATGSGARRRIELVTNVCLTTGTATPSGSGSPE